jgi:ribonuclease Z
MQLQFLGTSAGRPTQTRNVTSIVLTALDNSNYWLFDAGEGTQHRLLGTKLKLNKLERIFITHLHGDHLYGLPGLLCSRSYHEGAGLLRLYGPPGIRAYIECVFHQSSAHLDYELEIMEIEPGVVFADDNCQVVAEELDHRIRCYGYRVIENPIPGALDLDKLMSLGIPPGPIYGQFKRGEDVLSPEGSLIRSADVVGPFTQGRIVTILGDTRPCDQAYRLAKDADLLVHEATFSAGLEEKAEAYGHSTALQAAEIAAKSGAKRLIVTHFSSRYDVEAVAHLVDEVKNIFPNIEAAYDYMEISVPKPKPKINPDMKDPK